MGSLQHVSERRIEIYLYLHQVLHNIGREIRYKEIYVHPYWGTEVGLSDKNASPFLNKALKRSRPGGKNV